jgi:hypothetical protein
VIPLNKLKINKNCLDPGSSGYIELGGVCSSIYGETKTAQGSFPKITAVYPTSEQIPADGELFDLASEVIRHSDALAEYNEPAWNGSEKDRILEYPKATVFLMSQTSYNIYRESYIEASMEEETLIME